MKIILTLEEISDMVIKQAIADGIFGYNSEIEISYVYNKDGHLDNMILEKVNIDDKSKET